MKRRLLVILLIVQVLVVSPTFAQSVRKAKRRVFLGTGPTTRTLVKHHDKYYALLWADRSVIVYNSQMQFIGRSSSYGQGPADLMGPWDIAIGPAGSLYVADRGSGQVKVFNERGEYVRSIDVRNPVSLAVLGTGEVCVVGFPRRSLVSVYDESGTFQREFGELETITSEPRLNAFLNSGKIVVDADDNIYFAFLWNPEPTIRKYTKDGELVLEFHPKGKRIREASDAAREAIKTRLAQGRIGGKGVFSGLAVDPKSGDIWVSTADWIFRFKKDGKPKDTFRITDPSGNPINADAILIESDRVYITSRPSGIFEFDHPDNH